MTVAPDQLQNLLRQLQAYLRKEGLLQALPEFAINEAARRHPWQWYWTAILVTASLLVKLIALIAVPLSSASLPAFLAAALLPLSISVVTFHILDWIQWKQRVPSKWTSRIWMIGSAVLSAGFCAWLSKSVYAAMACIGLAAIFYKILNRLVKDLHSVILLSDLVSGLCRDLQRSVAALARMLLLLAVFVLLSIFSEELWISVGKLTWLRWGVATALVMLVGLLILAIRWKPFLKTLGDEPSSSDSRLVLEGVLKVSLSSGSEQIVQNVFGIPEIKALKQDQLCLDLQAELDWRDLDQARREIIPHLRRAWRLRVLARLFTTGMMLAVALFVVLGVLLWIIFYPSSFFIDDLQGVGLAATAVVLAKVVLFLVAILAAEFIARVLTDSDLQREIFGELGATVRRWADALISCLALSRPEYELPVEYWHKELGVVELVVIVPADADTNHVKRVCEHITHRAACEPCQIVFTVFPQQKSDIYDICTARHYWHGDEERIVDEKSLCHQHTLGLDSRKSGTPLDPQWFGDGPQWFAGHILWDHDFDHNVIYHPYGYEACDVLWILLRLQQSDIDIASCRERAQWALGRLKEHYHSLPSSVLIAVYGRDDERSCGHLLWRRNQPEGVSWIDTTSANRFS